VTLADGFAAAAAAAQGRLRRESGGFPPTGLFVVVVVGSADNKGGGNGRGLRRFLSVRRERGDGASDNDSWGLAAAAAAALTQNTAGMSVIGATMGGMLAILRN